MVATIVPATTAHRALRPQSDQRARGDAGGRPEHGHALGSEQGKAHPCRQDVDAADHDGEPDRAHPPPRRVSRVGTPGSHSQIFQHVAVSDALFLCSTGRVRRVDFQFHDQGCNEDFAGNNSNHWGPL